ncbi:MAG: hypothetical protein WC621_01495 [Patescibacteria group bacterium]
MTNSNDHLSSVGKVAVFVSSQSEGAEFDITLQLPSGEYKFAKLKIISCGNEQVEISSDGLTDKIYCRLFRVGNTFQLPKVLKNQVGTITVIWKHD